MKHLPSPFSAAFFSGNRHRLRTLFEGTAPIIIAANGIMQRSGDNPYLFQQDSNFWYLTGIDVPGAVLVMDKGKEYLMVPELDAVRQAFDGEYSNNAIADTSGIEEVVNEKEGWKRLGPRLKKAAYFASLAPPEPYVEHYGIYTNPARKDVHAKVYTLNASIELIDLRTEFASMRCIKQPEELLALKHAIKITEYAIKKALAYFKNRKLRYEYELEALITHEIRFSGADGYGYDPVVASGPRATTLHYQQNNHEVADNELVLFDVGAQYQRYTADITRVVSFGKASRRQHNIWDAVLEVQDFAASILKPGIILREYEKEVELYMGEKLRSLGLIKVINHDSVRKFFPHAASHSIGLDAHDIIDYSGTVKEGMVLQVEPGIYIREESIGMRVEDAYVITKKGAKKISNNLSTELEARKLPIR